MTNKIFYLALLTCFLKFISGVRANYPDFPQYPSSPISPSTPINPQSPIDPGLLAGLQYLTSPLTSATKELGNLTKDIPILSHTVKGLTDSLDRLDDALVNGNDGDAVIGMLQTLTGPLDSTVKGIASTIGSPIDLDSVCIVKMAPYIVGGFFSGSYITSGINSILVYQNCKQQGLLTHTVGSLKSLYGGG